MNIFSAEIQEFLLFPDDEVDALLAAALDFFERVGWFPENNTSVHVRKRTRSGDSAPPTFLRTYVAVALLSQEQKRLTPLINLCIDTCRMIVCVYKKTPCFMYILQKNIIILCPKQGTLHIEFLALKAVH